MMRKFTLSLLMVLVFGFISFGQTYTASLPTVTASPNENVAINLGVTGFTSIGSFTLTMQVDPAVLSFQNVTNFATGIGTVSVSPAGSSTITVAWSNNVPHTWANGTLLTLNFTYNGLSSPIAFVPSACEVTKLVGTTITPLTGTFTDGAVSPFLSNTEQAHIGTVSAASGSMVTVPLTYTGSSSLLAGSITQYISYDPAKLSFINVTGSGLFPAFVNNSAASGIITFTWTNPAGVLINTSGTQFNLNFQYTGNTNTNVSFSTGCVITTPAGANIPVTYNNGAVNLLAPPTSFASLAPAITNAVQGQMVDVPLTFSGMAAGTISNFDIHLTYDNPRMSFIGIFNQVYPVTSSASGNTINISYVNASAPAINGQFLVLRFMYNGIGTASVNFAPTTQFANTNPVLVGYTNGSVSPAPATVNATIGMVSAVSPATIAVPVTLSDIPTGTDIGAITMNIGFDASKLTYVNALNPFNATIDLNGNVLHIAWATTTPTALNGIPFVTLNFNYAASGNASTQVTFNDGCQLANLGGTIVPANWNNGGINLFYKISGTLTYDAPSTELMNNVTIYIKDGAEPVPPATSPVPNILYTTTTNASGYFEVNVPNGTYYLYAAATAKAWGGVDGGDVTQIRRKIANLSNGIDGSPIRLRSADVSQDAIIDGTDVTALRRRIANLTPNPNYKAPDWIFENPVVIVNGAAMPNQNFKGLCSGDVNGSYPN